jgi:hypothetical protein
MTVTPSKQEQPAGAAPPASTEAQSAQTSEATGQPEQPPAGANTQEPQAQPTQISPETGLPEQTPAEAIVQGPVQVDVRRAMFPYEPANHIDDLFPLGRPRLR